MNRQETAALLAYVARLDPRSTPADQAEAGDRLDQWYELLADVPATAPHPEGRHWDAAQAVRHHIATSPYPIKPADVVRPWQAFRRAALDRHTDPVPDADPDDPAAYRAALLGTRLAVATGAAAPTTLRELTTGGPAPELAARLSAVGEMPSRLRAELAERGIGNRRTRFPELSVDCPRADCRARRSMPCKRPSGAELRDHTHPQRQAAHAAALSASGGAGGSSSPSPLSSPSG
ncbi:cell surface glycoprotein [Streptomyces sp. NPDC003077]|uniref:cell surface glycoprotein n=1 Tax=Streptomyces sp. NPDC003077 TaxID=3154443 RepID=UPI0033A47A7D